VRVHELVAAGDQDAVVISRSLSDTTREQLSPASLACHCFGDGLSVLDLLDPDRTGRLDRHLGFDSCAEPLPRRTREMSR